MNIHFYDVHDWEKPYLEKRSRELFSDAELHFDTQPLNEETPMTNADAECVSIFVDSRMTRSVIDRFPQLKLIATRSTGFDMVDMEYAKARGIMVANVPSYGEHTVAEFTLGLMLTLSRKLDECIGRTREQWRFDHDGLTGFDLIGKTLGVIGTGRIGMSVVTLAKALGMKVLAYDAFPKHDLATVVGFTYADLETLLESSDIVTLHLPGTKDGSYMIDADALSRMKPAAYLINTSRGSLVDTKALTAALKAKKLAGAALDVLEDEPALQAGLANHPLVQMQNVIITPHTAFNTTEAIERILETALQNIYEFKKGVLQNLV